jgi:CubicO group peptidase (beta-lactamase class C family)
MPPGQRFGYDNGGPNLLAAAATEILGEPVSAFAAHTVFDPIGISDFRWRTDPEGYPVAADGLELTANDLGALGQLWLDGGRGLVDPGFLAEMTRTRPAVRRKGWRTDS